MFLFQSKCAQKRHLFFAFTFHYVSISIFTIMPSLTSPSCFTFHYVSISIKVVKELEDLRDFTLHSTMFLFQLLFVKIFVVHIFLYIPLCFYFNGISFGQANEILDTLHSTMFLFQS